VVEHRRTPSRRAYVLPGWVLAVVAAACVLGVIGLAWVALSGGDDDQMPASYGGPTSSTASPSSSPTPTPTATPTPTPTPSESPTPSPTPEVDRSAIAVSVLNASTTTGLARQVAQRVEQAGWTVGAIGNWRTGSTVNAVHYPAGHEAEARLLAKDLGIDAVLPSTNGMSTVRLTVVLHRLP
jgi:cytoskeletal protein RodZ